MVDLKQRIRAAVIMGDYGLNLQTVYVFAPAESWKGAKIWTVWNGARRNQKYGLAGDPRGLVWETLPGNAYQTKQSSI